GMVIHSLFPLFVQKLKHQYGTITNLGGNAGFMRGIWFIQLSIVFSFAFVIGIVGAYLTINLAGRAYSLNSFINLSVANTILAMAIMVLFIAFEGWFVFRKMKELSLIGLSTDYRYEKHKTSTIYMIVLLTGLILMIIIQPFETAIDSFLIVILSLLAGFQIISFVLEKVAGSSLRKKPRNLFQAFNLKYMADNKYIHNSLRVLFASFVVVATTLSVRVFVINEVDFFIDQINFDYAMTNITNYDDALKTEIIQNYAVEAVDEVIFYRDVRLLIDSQGEIEKEKMQFFVSLEGDRFDEYFNFDRVEPIGSDYLENDEIYVVIPKSLGKIYDLEIGETISLLINSEHDIMEVEIAGFLDTNFDNVVYSNLLFVPEYEEEFSINSLLIQSDEEDDIFIELLEDYGSQMYYVLDINALINDFGSIYKTASSLFLVLTSIMIVSFLIVIVNNTLLVFQTMKHDYAELKTLGVSNSEFGKCIAYEIGLGFSLVLMIAAFEVVLLTEFMPEIMLFFNYYKEISPTPYVLISSVMIVFVAYVVSYLLYYIRIGKLEITDEIYKE
ncbi:MAG: hypothetical protein JXB20_03140, partial [Bacilli bacterium]|nr:hypothetical protein [Bacilli bacterium]